jgi:hypothetical protein
MGEATSGAELDCEDLMNGEHVSPRTHMSDIIGVSGILWSQQLAFGFSKENVNKETVMSVAVAEKGCAVIDEIVSTCERIRSGDHDLKPGTPVYLTGAESVGDAISQGDFWIVVSDKTPDQVKADPNFKYSKNQEQLVVGNTEGAKHCLCQGDATNSAVDVYIPTDWNEESMQGPFLVVKKPGAIVMHPKHGHVHPYKDTVYECLYQKELDREQKAERRSRD